MKNPQILLCTCGDVNHQLVFEPYEDEVVKEVVLSYHLSSEKPFFKRCWLALKYIFGFKNESGHFGYVILDNENIEPLKAVCEYLES